MSDYAEIGGAAAERLEQLADALERIMPKIREARAALSDMSPDVARHAEFEGSHEQLDVATAEGLGFDRIEAARRRIAAAVHDPFDELDT